MARRKKAHIEGPHDDEGRWLLTYSDLITLLFVLFVVMYAISTTDTRKLTELAQSLSAAFNADVFSGQKAVTISAGQDTQVMQVDYSTGSSLVATDMRSIEADLQDFAIGQGIGGDVDVTLTPEGIVIRLNDALLFSSGRAFLNDDATAVIKQVAIIVGPLPNNIRIEGNTDDQPPDGGLYADNWELSTARALAVLRAMESEGISPTRLSALGNAQYNPLAPNTDDASRAKNRRVDIVVLYPKESGTPSETSSPLFP